MSVTTLASELTAVGVAPDSQLASVILVAVGHDAAGQLLPVTGYFLSAATNPATTVPDLVLYMVAGGDLVRFEAAGTSTLTVTLPVEKVTCLTERTSSDEYSLTVEFDAQSLGMMAETRQDGDVLRQVARTDRATYTLAAPLTGPVAPGAPGAEQLLMFRRALRAAMAARR